MISIDENARRKFESAWLDAESSASLEIRDFLPQGSEETYLGTLEELVCIDMEFRWQPRDSQASKSNQTVSVQQYEFRTRVEDYLRDFPELDEQQIIQRLVEQEIYVRVNAGFLVEPSEYRSRFPGVNLDDSLFSQGESDTRVDAKAQPQQLTALPLPYAFGNYVLQDLLGRGGMGSVYIAEQPAAKRRVAIKIAEVESLSPHSRQLMCARFEQEAHAAAAVVHDHIVPIYDVGVFDGKPFIAMQMVEGGDLGKRSKEEPISPKNAAQYLKGIAAGVAEAHKAGMLHRDIKPQNILIDNSTNRAMLTDFGLARYTEDDSGMTQAGQLLGTPSFMPPEQIRDSSKIDARADVYSLGATLYQLVTGKAPFKASDIHETLRQVLNVDATSPRELNSEVDRDLETICLKCLEKEPDLRYPSADELAEDLNRYVDGRPINARPAGPIRKLAKWCRRNPALAFAQGAAVAGLLLTVAVSLIGWRASHQQWLVTESVLKKSTATVDDLFVQVKDEPLMTSPGFEVIREQLLQRAIEHYRGFVGIIEREGGLADEIAYANAALASMYVDLSFSIEESKEQIDAAKNSFARLTEQQRSTPKMLEAQSDLYLASGRIAFSEMDLGTMLADFEEAVAFRKRWFEAEPESIEAARKLANSIMNVGLAQRQQAQAAAAEGQADSAGELLASAEGNLFDAQKLRNAAIQTAAENGIDPSQKLRRDQAKAEFALGNLEMAHGNIGECIARFESAEAKFYDLANEVAVDASLWEDLALARVQVASLLTALPTYWEDATAQQDAAKKLQQAFRDLTQTLSARNSIGKQLSLLQLSQRCIDSGVLAGHLKMAFEQSVELESIVLQVKNNYDASSQEDGTAERESIQESFVRIRLNQGKHRAQLAVDREPKSEVVQRIAEAIELYESHQKLVNADPLLSNDYRGLKSLRDAITSSELNTDPSADDPGTAGSKEGIQ
ncbi:MAG: serine/threonine-protein kinase [Aureliella sp.]